MADFSEDSKQDVTINVRAIVDDLLDGYFDKEPRSSHWMQKDGIQNCWDARKDKNNKKKKWKCIIELHEGKNNLITITDHGTWGLIGRRWTNEELSKEDPGNDERWTKFENMAFANKEDPDKEVLGSRGRGKFVFSGCSKVRTTLYDTLRDDGLYRIGMRKVEKVNAPTWVAEHPPYKPGHDDAYDVLSKHTDGILKPLDHIGTRIIILDPKKEVMDDIKSGKFEEFISDTWWEIISKYGAEVIIKVGSKKKVVKSFADENYFEKAKTKDQRILKKECIKIPNHANLKVKKFYVKYDPDMTYEKRQKGIAIQRGGMNVCRFDATEILDPEYGKHITGYITFERDFEKLMRDAEGVEHYSYQMGWIPLKDVKQLMVSEIMQWATKELGFSNVAKQKTTKAEKQASSRALKAANSIAKIMGLGVGGGGGGGHTRTTTTIEHLMEVKLNKSEFPKTNSIRVDYGESIKNIGAKVHNNMKDRDIVVGLRIMVKSANRDDLIFDGPIFKKKDVAVKRNSKTDYFHMKSLKIDKQNFKPGHYKIITDISLMTPFKKFQKAERVDSEVISFWVETDPPEGGMWERYDARNFENLEPPKNTMRAVHKPSLQKKDTYVLEFNKDHHDYKEIDPNDEVAVAKYLYRLTIPETCIIDLERDDTKLFSKEDLQEPFKITTRMKGIIDEFTSQKHMEKI
jgi:hypothetical protein